MIDKKSLTTPIELMPARAYRTFLGGSLIDKMHGKNCEDNHFPEEWISSCTQAINIGREDIIEGLSYAVMGGKKVLLASLVQRYPKFLLGEKHYNRYGTSLAMLAKIIDSKERLAIQFHPNNEQAKKLFNSPFGKTECWHILSVRNTEGDNPHIYLGLKKGVTKEVFINYFNVQDVDRMISSLNKVYVSPGETYFIEGGIPHAIGSGCMLAELQEPTDFTLRTERQTPSGLKFKDETIHLGLGFDKMFDCFNFETFTYDEILKRCQIPSKVIDENDDYKHEILIGDDTTSRFAMEAVSVHSKAFLPAHESFYVIKCLNGTGVMKCKDKKYTIERGKEFFVPANSESIEIDGNVKILMFLPPTQ